MEAKGRIMKINICIRHIIFIITRNDIMLLDPCTYMFITATCMLIAPCTCMWLTILQWHVYIYTSMMTCFLVFLPPRSQIVGYFSKSMEFVMAWTSELANMCITYNNKWKDMCNYFHGTTTTNGKTCATLSMVVTQFAIA